MLEVSVRQPGGLENPAYAANKEHKLMTIGFMTWVCPDWGLNQILTATIRYGYDGVEPRAQVSHPHGVEIAATKKQRATIKAQFADCGVLMPCIATSIQYAHSEGDKIAESIELSKRHVQLAADLGCPNLRVFGGPTPEGMSFDDAKRRVADSLYEAAQFAAGFGVYLCLETHDAYSLAKDCVEVVKMVDHLHAAITWDIMHPFRQGETIEESFDWVHDYVRHCHVHDGTWPDENPEGTTLALMGEGRIPHDEAVRLLSAIGFEGALSGEWIGAFEPEVVLPHDAQKLRQYIEAAGG